MGAFDGSDWAWTSQSAALGSGDWAVACDSDFTKLVAAKSSGELYNGPFDGSTVTWNLNTDAGSRAWNALVSSSDGNKILAATSGSYIWKGVFDGASWSWTEQTAAGKYYIYMLKIFKVVLCISVCDVK